MAVKHELNAGGALRFEGTLEGDKVLPTVTSPPELSRF
jgi:hypothetical protein